MIHCADVPAQSDCVFVVLLCVHCVLAVCLLCGCCVFTVCLLCVYCVFIVYLLCACSLLWPGLELRPRCWTLTACWSCCRSAGTCCLCCEDPSWWVCLTMLFLVFSIVSVVSVVSVWARSCRLSITDQKHQGCFYMSCKLVCHVITQRNGFYTDRLKVWAELWKIWSFFYILKII